MREPTGKARQGTIQHIEGPRHQDNDTGGEEVAGNDKHGSADTDQEAEPREGIRRKRCPGQKPDNR
jgi:hypothetical protein